MINATQKLDALIRREAAVREAKAALRAEKAKRRQLAHRTAAEIHSLLGAAVAADLEVDTAKIEFRAPTSRRYSTGPTARAAARARCSKPTGGYE